MRRAAPARAHTATPGLADVASRAGVSLATASRALNRDNTHPVSAETRERVVAAAQELDYQFNSSARSLRTGRLATIAVVVHDIADPYFAEIVRVVTSAASEAGLLTMVCSTDRDPATELRYVEMLRQSRAAAVLFAGGGLEDPAYKRAIKRHAQAIDAYGGAVVAMAPRAELWPAEMADNRGGAEAAARYIIGLGHRQVALIKGPPQLRTSREREEGFLTALGEAGIVPIAVTGDFTSEGGGRAANQLVDSGRDFSAVIVCNDAMAIGALEQFRRAGISVPYSLSVIGFDDVPGLGYIHPALTTMRAPLSLIGTAAVTRALDILEGSRSDRRPHLHPVELVVRSSTGPVGPDWRKATAAAASRGKRAAAPRRSRSRTSSSDAPA